MHDFDTPDLWHNTQSSLACTPRDQQTDEDPTDWTIFDDWDDDVESVGKQFCTKEDIRKVSSLDGTNLDVRKPLASSQESDVSDETEWEYDGSRNTNQDYSKCDGEEWMWEDELEWQEDSTDQTVPKSPDCFGSDLSQSITNHHYKDNPQIGNKSPLDDEEIESQSDAFWEL